MEEMRIMEFYEILEKVDNDKILEIYGACSRKIRNMLEGIYYKKKKKGRKISLRAGQNKLAAANAVRNGIVKASDEQMAEEVLKTWLYTKRELFVAALDFFEIKHEDGITDESLELMEKAESALLDKMVATLQAANFATADIMIYLAFMKVENLSDVKKFSDIF